MDGLEDLFNEALRVKLEDFLELIAQVDQILLEEELSNELKTGRLIHLPPRGEAIILGDIHGDLSSLKHILFETKFMEKAFKGDDVYLIFLGDYGDRGIYSPEVYYIVLSLKKRFPEKVILLQGNHEGPEDLPVFPHDLPFYLNRKFGSGGMKAYNKLSGLFRRFYTAVIVEEKFIMLHGGVPSEAKSLDDVAFAYKKHPLERHLEEILWSDPVDEVRGKLPSPRGAGYIFGEDITSRFLKNLGVNFLIRGHEPVFNGYRFNHGGKVLTLFSRRGAPYFNSHAAYLVLNLSGDYSRVGDLEKYIRIF